MKQLTMFIASSALAACASSSSNDGASAEGSVEILTYDADIEQTGLDNVKLTFPWELKNPTAEKASVGKVTWSLEIETEKPINGEETPTVSATNGSGESALVVSAGLTNTPEAFVARDAKVALPYTMKAAFEVAADGKTDTYESEWYGELFPPKRPTVTLKAEAGRYGDKGFEINFIIGVANPNPFPITVGQLEYTLFVKETEISKDLLAKGRELPSTAEFQFDVQRFVGQDDMHELAKELKAMDVIPYRFDGHLTIQGVVIPVPIEGEITFGR